MKYEASSLEDYLNQLPEERKQGVKRLRNTIKENLPEGFEETLTNGMLNYVVPHALYPLGYHVNPDHPLPFISLASQKNYIALYHMGLYTFEDVLTWFQEAYPKHVKTKLDMGKSCIRFKKMDSIPYDLLAELFRKITLEDYIKRVELEIQRLKR